MPVDVFNDDDDSDCMDVACHTFVFGSRISALQYFAFVKKILVSCFLMLVY